MIRVLIVDDHTVVREGLKQIFSDESDIEIIDEARTGDEGLAKIEKYRPDVVLLDISLPGKSGIEIIKQVKSQGIPSKILVLTMYSEDQYAIRVMKSGADGYLTKDSASVELLSAVRQIFHKGKYINPSLAIKLASEVNTHSDKPLHERLSDREFQVMKMLAAGKMVSEIASELNLSVKTISTNRSRILEKTGLRNNAELMSYALKNGLVEQVD
ncbi:MAG: DNA-binding response regulator [Candidatus Marinimicrobia bacterium CG08_land_8_20_14_0_20_45_22]|nr:MAG: DNA-binding response regulator [Candidatus Marinimicrobia bacterium CG08_land_8_20_14_0_20_45_22]